MVCRTGYSTLADQNLLQYLSFLPPTRGESPDHPHFDLDARTLSRV